MIFIKIFKYNCLSADIDESAQPGETVELGLAVCLPVLVLLVFVGSEEQEIFPILSNLSSNFRYVVTVLWRCCFKEKLQVEQKPFPSNIADQARKYKMFSNSHTQTSLLHLQPPNSTGRPVSGQYLDQI